MARPGITKEEVFTVAAQLTVQGIGPTVEQIRSILQTGSNSTIANHLREWRKTQNGAQGLAFHAQLPDEAVGLINGLWERLKQIADNKCALLEREHQEKMTKLSNELEKYRSNNNRWQNLFNQWQEEKNQLITESNKQTETISLLEKDKSSLQSAQDIKTKQLDEKSKRIDELHQLHQQTQTNLEHYRETAREERLLMLDIYEKQKQELQQVIHSLKEQLNLSLHEKTSLQNEYQSLLKSYAETERSQAKTSAQNDYLLNQLTSLEKSMNESMEREKREKTAWQKVQEKFDLQTKTVLNLEIENKQLTQQVQALKQNYNELLAAKDLLSNEKWTLIQEKGQLEGQLKQLR